jgi:hypothetical protein
MLALPCVTARIAKFVVKIIHPGSPYGKIVAKSWQNPSTPMAINI